MSPFFLFNFTVNLMLLKSGCLIALEIVESSLIKDME